MVIFQVYVDDQLLTEVAFLVNDGQLCFLFVFMLKDFSLFFFIFFLPQVYYTMILQRIRIIVGDAEIKPGTSTKEAWCAIPMSHHPIICINYRLFCNQCIDLLAASSAFAPFYVRIIIVILLYFVQLLHILFHFLSDNCFLSFSYRPFIGHSILYRIFL